MFSPAPFIDTEDLNLYLRKASTGNLGVIAVDSACQIVRDYIKQQVNYVEDDEILVSGDGTDCLFLPELPVWDVLSVHESDEDGANETELDGGPDFVLGDGGLLWRRGGDWPDGKMNIRVTYTHGWSPTPPGSGDDFEAVPPTLRMIALQVAARIYEQGLSSSLQVDEFTEEFLSDTGAALNASEKATLDRYRVRYGRKTA